MTERQKRLHELMQSADANENLCAYVYDMIISAPKNEQAALFEQFTLEYKYTPSDKSARVPQVFHTEADVKRRLQTLRAVASVLMDTAKQHTAASKRNAAVWDMLSNVSMFQDKTTRYLLLACCAEDPKFPFQYDGKIDGPQLPAWKQLETIDPLLVLSIKHAAAQLYEDTTREAAVYLQLLEQGKTESEKTVLLGLILASFKCRIMDSALHEN